MNAHLRSAVFVISFVWKACSALGQARYDSANVFVHLYPLQAVDLISRNMFVVGAEYRTAGRWTFGAGGGFKLFDDGPRDTMWVNPYGYSVHAEVKRYFKEPHRRIRFFVSCEYRWITEGRNRSLRYYDEREVVQGQGVDVWYTDAFGEDLEIHVLNAKFGVMVLLHNHWYLEPYSGWGVRWRSIDVSNIEYTLNPYARQSWRDNWPLGDYHPTDPRSPVLNFSLGLKVGYRF